MLKAGEYRFTGELRPADVIAKLARGEVYLRPVTFPEGLTIQEMGKLFESRGFGAAACVRGRRPQPRSWWPRSTPPRPTWRGTCTPETYPLAAPRERRRCSCARWSRASSKSSAPNCDRPPQPAPTVREVVTLASLVEKETARPEERPTVAAVYLNRLKIGMGLQCDPTVIYALQKAGRFTGNLTRADLAFDSPYNTYKYAGPPSWPDRSPGPPISRGRAQTSGGGLPVLREPERRFTRVLHHLRRAPGQGAGVSGGIFRKRRSDAK